MSGRERIFGILLIWCITLQAAAAMASSQAAVWKVQPKVHANASLSKVFKQHMHMNSQEDTGGHKEGVFFALEVPSPPGLFADRKGRRGAMLLDLLAQKRSANVRVLLNYSKTANLGS